MECLELTYKKPQRQLGGYYDYSYNYYDYDDDYTPPPRYEFKPMKRNLKATWSKELAKEFGVEYCGSETGTGIGNIDCNVQKAG